MDNTDSMTVQEAYWHNRGLADKGKEIYPFDQTYRNANPLAIAAYMTGFSPTV